LNLNKFLWEYGEKVPGYNVTVINEREARAASGILYMLGMIVIFVGIGYNHIIAARIYLAFLFFDFTIRLFTPRYSPSMMLGKFFVKDQEPEYVGGLQKRFAWTLGWLIAIPMMDWFVIHWDITFYKVLVCILCLTLMFLETAFSICVGCWIYKTFIDRNVEHCPGGVCKVQKKDPVQIFTPVQKIIAFVTGIALIIGVYLFLAKTESKTFFGEFLHELVLTKQQLQKEEEEQMDKAFNEESDDDF